MSNMKIIIDGQSIIVNRNELTEEAITNLLTVAIKSKLIMNKYKNQPLNTAILNICKCGKTVCK